MYVEEFAITPVRTAAIELITMNPSPFILWKDMFRLVIQEGCLLYMTGEIGSQALVEYGAFTPKFYNFFKAIKKTLDPNMILSRGKYNFFEEVMKG